MDEITFKATLKYLKSRFPKDEFIQSAHSLNSLPIEYLAPFNPSTIDDKLLDIVLSHTVFEHIPKNAIYNLLLSLKSKMSNNSIMVHLIDHSDHFEHYDKSISRINFLTWDKKKHALINWFIKDGENRMRHHEYNGLFVETGYRIVDEEADIHEDTRKSVKSLNLAYPYSTMTPEQLAILTSIFTLQKT
nr:hypothetical protein [uncultured Desulfobacter sp.]